LADMLEQRYGREWGTAFAPQYEQVISLTPTGPVIHRTRRK
jgi:hypothetical protein